MITVAGLVKDLQSSNKATRMNAIRSLGQIGTAARITIPLLVRLLDDADPEVASLSLRALAFMGPNTSLKPKIVQRLGDPSPEMRRMAAFAIGSMGAACHDVIPLLASLLKTRISQFKYALLVIWKLSGESGPKCLA